MKTEFERVLQDTAVGFSLDTPTHAVLARGDQLRRRHHRRIGAGVVGLCAAAALGATLILPPGTNPVVVPAVAAWSGPATNLTPEQVRAISEACGEEYNTTTGTGAVGGSQKSPTPLWAFPSNTLPVAAEIRGDLVLAYFEAGGTAGDCALKLADDDSFQVIGQSAGERQESPSDKHLTFETLRFGDPGAVGGPVADVVAVLRVSPQVAGVTLEVGGETFAGSVDHGLAFFWATEVGLTPREVERAGFTAFDAEGAVLARHELGSGEDW